MDLGWGREKEKRERGVDWGGGTDGALEMEQVYSLWFIIILFFFALLPSFLWVFLYE